MNVSHHAVSSTIKKNPLAFCLLSLIPFSAKPLGSVFCIHRLHVLSSCLLLNHSTQGSVSTLQKTALTNLASRLKIAASNRQCSWFSFCWPTSSFRKLSLCVLSTALFMWLSERDTWPGSPGFPLAIYFAGSLKHFCWFLLICPLMDSACHKDWFTGLLSSPMS